MGSEVVSQTLTMGTGMWSSPPDSYGYRWVVAGSVVSSTDSYTSTNVGDVVEAFVRAVKGDYTSPWVSAGTKTIVVA